MTTNNDLRGRVSAFRCLALPGQPMMMHMGTSSLVGDLWNEVKALQEQLELARVKTYCASISEIAIERDAMREAMREAQTVEPVALLTVPPSGTGLVTGCLKAAFDLPEGDYALFTHPAPPLSGERPVNCGSSHCSCIECVVDDEQPPIGEREALIERHIHVAKHGVNPSMRDLARQTADMLAADAQEITALRAQYATCTEAHDSTMARAMRAEATLTAQQVAVPQGWADAVNLARNLMQHPKEDTVTPRGIRMLIEAVIGVDEVLAAAPQPPQAERVPITDDEIEARWKRTFSTDNPYCPCNLKTFTKAVRATEAHHGIKP